MIPKSRQAKEGRAWMAPAASLVMAALVLWFQPRYAAWFGKLPSLTQTFFDNYLLLIAISAAALFVTIAAHKYAGFMKRCALCRAVDMMLTLLSGLIIIVGLIAVMMPLLSVRGS